MSSSILLWVFWATIVGAALVLALIIRRVNKEDADYYRRQSEFQKTMEEEK